MVLRGWRVTYGSLSTKYNKQEYDYYTDLGHFLLYWWVSRDLVIFLFLVKPVNLKGNQPRIFVGRTDVKAPILWPPDANSWLIGEDPDAGKDWRQEEKRVTEDEVVGWHHQFNGYELRQAPWDGEGQENLACCSPWDCQGLDTAWWLNNDSSWYREADTLTSGHSLINVNASYQTVTFTRFSDLLLCLLFLKNNQSKIIFLC